MAGIKTKLFTGSSNTKTAPGKFVECDVEMNEFLEENSVEVIDVKFAAATDSDGTIWFSSLLIYKGETK